MDQINGRMTGLELMRASPAVYLTTLDSSGFPETRAMLNLRNRAVYPALAAAFAEHDEDFLVYFTTNTSSSKAAQLRRDPRVAAYFCVPGEWRGLNLQGNIEIVEDPAVKTLLWQKDWMMYYPGGPGDEDYAILRLLPRTAKGYHQFARYSLDFAETSRG